MSPERLSKFYLVHGPSNYMIEECFKIQEWQQEQVATASTKFSETSNSMRDRLVPSFPEHSLTLPNVIAVFQGMQVYQCFSYDTPLSLGLNTGASRNLLSV